MRSGALGVAPGPQCVRPDERDHVSAAPCNQREKTKTKQIYFQNTKKTNVSYLSKVIYANQRNICEALCQNFKIALINKIGKIKLKKINVGL